MNLSRLIALENLERGLRVEMRDYFAHSPNEAILHPCETACCHGGWTLVLMHATGQHVEPGFADTRTRTINGFEIDIAMRFLELPYRVTEWLFNAWSRLEDPTVYKPCSEREGRLRLRILIELQSEDVALLTAELQRRMSEPAAPATAEVREEVCA